MREQNIGMQSTTTQLLQDMVSHSDLFAKLIEAFPYPVQVFAPDGTMLIVNQAFSKEFHIPDPSMLIGKYNILLDPSAEEYGALQNVKNAFAGIPAFVTDFMVPVNVIKKNFNIPTEDIEIFYLDVSTLPLLDENKKIICVVNILIIRRKLVDRVEIAAAKTYIESHWLSKFCVEDVAKAVFLSSSHFSRMFKIHTGMTPHEYYINIKIDRIKEKLLEINLSIEEAFTACGVNYHSYYTRLFKKKTGLTPLEYRKLAQK
ncbi:MAG: helix-turn-helix domain-containing protein [Clostridia bacterium]|nr:helix-turn-helix domain-containing protein [Clostridia bacterium]